MEKTLTISIAAYNMEKFIDNTLRSVTDERVIDDLEIFVIDDGGSDGTLAKAKQFAERYPQSVFPVHKENGGYGSTVNYSIAHASGRYFKLLDGDDWFDRDGLLALVTALKTLDADVVITNYSRGFDAEHQVVQKIEGIAAGRKCRVCGLDTARPFVHHEITYKTEVLRRSQLSLPEHTLYTDIMYIAKPFCVADSIYYINSKVYCYRVGQNGQSVSRESVIRHIDEQWRVTEFACRCTAECGNVKPENKRYMTAVAVFSYQVGLRWFMRYIPASRDAIQSFETYDKMIRKISEDVYASVENRGKAGVLLRMLRCSGYRLYRPMKLLYTAVKR